MSDYHEALRVLNDAAYAAARAAGEVRAPEARELRGMAVRTDELVDANVKEAA